MFLFMLAAACTSPDELRAQRSDEPADASSQARRTSYVFGTVVHHERQELPQDAVVTVDLVDVSQEGRERFVASTRLERLGGVPIAFALRYPPRAVRDDRLYALRARVESDGRTIFRSPEDVPVLTRGNPDRVDIVVERVQG